MLDAGALIALDRGDRPMWALLRAASDADDFVAVPAGVIAQAWRGGRRQALLSRALTQCDEVVMDGATARACGRLCSRTGISDVIDASVAVAAAHFANRAFTVVATSDPNDIAVLTAALHADVSIQRV